MNPAIYIAIFLPMLLLIITRRRNEEITARLMKRRKDKEEKDKMTELAKGFIGKDCVIYLFNGNQYIGIVKEVSAGAILLERDASQEIINLDFVARIREYPRRKNGKKKSIVLD